MSSVRAIEPRDLRRRLDAGEPLQLLDVREAEELAICRVAGSLHLPLGELARRAAELDPERPVVCICHHGIRSASAAAWLAKDGEFPEVLNLAGGVDRWAAEVEPAMRRY